MILIAIKTNIKKRLLRLIHKAMFKTHFGLVLKMVFIILAINRKHFSLHEKGQFGSFFSRSKTIMDAFNTSLNLTRLLMTACLASFFFRIIRTSLQKFAA